MKLGRNDPCHCGSGKKYKHCHYEADRAAEAKRLNEAAAAVADKRKAEHGDEDGAEEAHHGSGHGKHQGSRFIRESGRGKRSPGGPGGASGGGAGSARVNRGSQRGG